jgi:hypothetical protein
MRGCARKPAYQRVNRMKWTPWLFGCLTAMLIAGCGGERRDTGTAGDAGTETGTMQDEAGTAADTAIPSTDTAATGTTGATPSDTARGGARITEDTTKPGAGTGGTADTVAPSDTARRVHDSTAGATH